MGPATIVTAAGWIRQAADGTPSGRDQLPLDQWRVVEAFRQALSSYERRLGNHSARVGNLAASLAAELALGRSLRLLTGDAGAVHDLGNISREILLKPGPLTARERREVERHPVIGAEALLAVSTDLAPVAETVRAHHECFDGRVTPTASRAGRSPWRAGCWRSSTSTTP